MRISDWSSDVCSSDPAGSHRGCGGQTGPIPGCARDDRGVPGQGVEMPAQQIAFSKSMNWALSLPGACLPEVQSAPGRPMLTHLPPFTGSMSWSLYRLLVQIGCGLNEQPSAEWMVKIGRASCRERVCTYV